MKKTIYFLFNTGTKEIYSKSERWEMCVSGISFLTFLTKEEAEEYIVENFDIRSFFDAKKSNYNVKVKKINAYIDAYVFPPSKCDYELYEKHDFIYANEKLFITEAMVDEDQQLMFEGYFVDEYDNDLYFINNGDAYEDVEFEYDLEEEI